MADNPELNQGPIAEVYGNSVLNDGEYDNRLTIQEIVDSEELGRSDPLVKKKDEQDIN